MINEVVVVVLALGTAICQHLVMRRLEAIDALLGKHDEMLSTMQHEMYGRQL